MGTTNGTTQRLPLPPSDPCSVCLGTGRGEDDGYSYTCPECDGTRVEQVPCEECPRTSRQRAVAIVDIQAVCADCAPRLIEESCDCCGDAYVTDRVRVGAHLCGPCNEEDEERELARDGRVALGRVRCTARFAARVSA